MPAASLPRVAHLPPPQAPPPARRLAAQQPFGSSAAAMPSMKRDSRMDQMGSLLSMEGPKDAPRVRPSAASISTTSLDHPLAIVGQPSDHAVHLPSRREAPPLQQAGFAAGRLTQASMPVVSVITGSDATPTAVPPPNGSALPRHEYKHPTYNIRRSAHESGVKDLLYGGEQPAAPPKQPAPAAPPSDPLAQVWAWLKSGISAIPKNDDGTTNEHAVRAGLEHVGLQLSIDGFAELLARCDIAPDGFPDFDAFVGCVNRPHREPPPQPADDRPPEPPSASEPTSEPTPPDGAAPQHDAPPAAAHDDEGHQTWRHLQVQEEMENRRPSVSFGKAHAAHAAGGGAPDAPPASHALLGPSVRGAPRSSFPLGAKSHVPTLGSNAASMYGKSRHVTSHKFSSSFSPDHFF
mmetsp:Transcript_19325/g.49737  ORF Transcript_19325/g.49737 Transcript_19325/m.49737 type:complete len:406 (-) Transcript_19325:280-1497(-)